MSANLFPIPVATPIQTKESGTGFSMVWQRYFKALGDDLLEANIVRDAAESKDFKYVVHGVVCNCIWSPSSVEAAKISLPFAAAVPFKAFGTVWPAGTKAVDIPAAAPFEQFFYFIQLSRT